MAEGRDLFEDLGDFKVDVDSRNILGKGSYGTVFPGYHNETQEKIAVKQFLVSDRKDCIEFVEKEAELLKKIPEHENIIKVLDVIKKEVSYKNKPHVNVWIAMEFCSLGDLKDYSSDTELTISQKLRIMVQSSLGLQHLHQCNPGVIHRDIKPENILVCGDPEAPTIKITDFGTARYLEYSEDKTKSLHSFQGTMKYMAPEMYSLTEDNKQPSYTSSIDIFALGLTFLALLECSVESEMSPYTVNDIELGKHMWKNRTQGYTADISKPEDSDTAKQIKDIIRDMLPLDKAGRLSAEEVIVKLREVKVELMVVVDGLESNDIWIHNGRWEVAGQLPSHHNALWTCFCVSGESIFVMGGCQGNPLSACNAFSLVTRRWKEMKPMPTARWGASAVIREHGTIIVAGGEINSRKNTKALEILNVVQNKWKQGKDLPEPLAKPLLAVFKNTVFILPCSFISDSDHLLKYDLSSDTYLDKVELPPSITSTRGACMLTCGGKVYLLGGKQKLAQQYSPDINQWTALKSPLNRYYMGNAADRIRKESLAVSKNDQHILLCGGSTSNLECSSGNLESHSSKPVKWNAVEEYDQETKEWKQVDTTLPCPFLYYSSCIGYITIQA